jgi:(p)ppGpp synthase/HD superfamily hydrolase
MSYLIPCDYSIRLIEKLKSLDSKNQLDFSLIDKAIYWVKKYHDGQFRKTGEPFYSHPLEVAYIVSDYNLKTDVIVTSILHDIVEDTIVTIEMILYTFGRRISEMVDRLTRDRPDGTKLSVKEILNNAYQLKDKEVLLIKLFDRLHNMQTIGDMSVEKAEKITNETLINFVLLSEYLQLTYTAKRIQQLCIKNRKDLTSEQMLHMNIFSFNDNYQPLSLIFQNDLC